MRVLVSFAGRLLSLCCTRFVQYMLAGRDKTMTIRRRVWRGVKTAFKKTGIQKTWPINGLFVSPSWHRTFCFLELLDDSLCWRRLIVTFNYATFSGPAEETGACKRVERTYRTRYIFGFCLNPSVNDTRRIWLKQRYCFRFSSESVSISGYRSASVHWFIQLFVISLWFLKLYYYCKSLCREHWSGVR